MTSLEDLIERVRGLDESASDYLSDRCCRPTTSQLVTAFPFVNSPQGHDYWMDIAERLGEVNRASLRTLEELRN